MMTHDRLIFFLPLNKMILNERCIQFLDKLSFIHKKITDNTDIYEVYKTCYPQETKKFTRKHQLAI